MQITCDGQNKKTLLSGEEVIQANFYLELVLCGCTFILCSNSCKSVAFFGEWQDFEAGLQQHPELLGFAAIK